MWWRNFPRPRKGSFLFRYISIASKYGTACNEYGLSAKLEVTGSGYIVKVE